MAKTPFAKLKEFQLFLVLLNKRLDPNQISIYIGWRKTLAHSFWLPCPCIHPRNNFSSCEIRFGVVFFFCQIDLLTSIPLGLLLHLLYWLDLAWGKNQGWVVNNIFSRSHPSVQKLKTIIANEAGSYLMLLHIRILSQTCRNAECKSRASCLDMRAGT